MTQSTIITSFEKPKSHLMRKNAEDNGFEVIDHDVQPVMALNDFTGWVHAVGTTFNSNSDEQTSGSSIKPKPKEGIF